MHSINHFFTPGKKTILLSLFIFNSFLVSSQIAISNQGSVPDSIIAHFAGKGLAISNVTISCDQNAYGSFSNGNSTNLGLSNGIILSTGSVSDVPGANTSASTTTDFSNGNDCNDPQLSSMLSNAQDKTYDCCILEFDIVPTCNQLSIRFVFGSEEYPEFVNQGVYDMFGFFISGPKPGGGNYTNQNIAALPNGTVVNIDNINNTVNSTYYASNNNGTTLQYDGFTTAITSTLALFPCQTYHFKMAIADVGDGLYDSGVFVDFIECSNAMSLSLTSTPPSGCNINDGAANINVSNGYPPFTYTWSPAPGGGQGTANATGLASNMTYTVYVNDTLSCSPTDSSVVTLSGGPVVTTNAVSTTSCPNQATSLSATSSPAGGTYLWAPGGASTSTINVQVASTTTYTVVYNVNGCIGTDTATVTVNPPQINISGLQTDTSHCNHPDGNISGLNVAAGTSPYTYSWYDALTNQLIQSGSPDLSNIEPGTYYLVVTDAMSCSDTSRVTVPNMDGVQVTLNGTPLTGYSPLSSSFIAGTTVPVTTYNWNFNNNASLNTPVPNSNYTFTTPGTYFVAVAVADTYGCVDTAYVTVIVDENVVIEIPNVFTPNGDVVNPLFEIHTKGVKAMHLLIYDRWGLLMSEKEDVNPSWDGITKGGKDAPEGTYYYVLDYTTSKNEQGKSAGYILLAR